MDELISIVKTRDNELEFDINIRGAQRQDPTVRLVIEDPKVNYSFNCSNLKDDKWVVNIPPLPHLTRKEYPFRLEVIIDGYYFEPYRKKLNIIPEPIVKSGKVAEKHPEKPVVNDKPKAAETTKKVVEKRTVAAPVTNRVTKEEVKISVPNIETQKVEQTDDFANMASAWLNRTKPVLTEQDKKVKNLIKDALEAKTVFVPPVSAFDPAPVVVPPMIVEEDKAKINDIKIKAILDSTKIK